MPVRLKLVMHLHEDSAPRPVSDVSYRSDVRYRYVSYGYVRPVSDTGSTYLHLI